MKYMVIGNSIAGISGIEAICNLDPGGEIVMLTGEPGPAPYSRCMTTHFIAGKAGKDKIYIRSSDFYDENNVKPQFGVNVKKVDPVEKKVYDDNNREYSFDRLLIASGASPVCPDIPGVDAGGVYTLRTLEDAENIRIQAQNGQRAVVLGAGPAGLKTAYALLQRGMGVSVVVGSPFILSQVMDEHGAGLIQACLEEQGMNFYLESGVSEIEKDSRGQVLGVKLYDDTELSCSLLVIGRGVRANTGFLSPGDFNIDKGLVVNEYMETGYEGIFAAGDVAQTRDMATGESGVYANWPNAAAQGHIAGRNIAGCRERYPGSLRMNALEFFGLSAVSVGFVNPAGSQFEVLERRNGAGRNYRRLVFSGDYLKGFVDVNSIEGVGTLTARIRAGTPVKDKYKLLHGRPPLIGNLSVSASRR